MRNSIFMEPLCKAPGYVYAPKEGVELDMTFFEHKEDFFYAELEPCEIMAIDRSSLSETMLDRTGVFLDLSECEQAEVMAKELAALKTIIEKELAHASGYLKTALEKTMTVILYAEAAGVGVIFWF